MSVRRSATSTTSAALRLVHPILRRPALRVKHAATAAAVVFAAFAAVARAEPPTCVEAAALTHTSVAVYWTRGTNASGYMIMRDGVPIGSAASASTSYVVTGLTPGSTHRYSVASVTDGVRGPASAPYIERTDPVLPAVRRCDVLVVGATTAGVAAAAAAGRYGLDVVLIEETGRLGGMSVNGLGASDIRRVDHASGFFEEFRRRVQTLYGAGNGLKYEPRIAHQAMKSILWEVPRLSVHRYARPISVVTDRGHIRSVVVENLRNGIPRATIEPRIVIDATECADVAAWSGAPYSVGRERRTAREPHAGHIYYDRARDTVMPASTGGADRRVQAYSFLMTVRDYGAGSDRTTQPPRGYDSRKYVGAPAWGVSWNATSGKLPNDKYEINQHPFGSDLQGTNYRYPEATYVERRRMEREFRDHALGYLHFMQTEQGMGRLGLSDDDFRADGGWPTSLYVREARRFRASRVMDETDIMRARSFVRPDAIGIGDYAMDSHATQPKTDPSTADMGEGEFYLPHLTPWHQVPYAIMIPDGIDNLFTPTAVSATHVAYGTYRMEPVRMHFGTAAGTAAALCLRHGIGLRSLPMARLQDELLKSSAGSTGALAADGIGAPGPTAYPTLLYTFSDVTLDTPRFRSIMWLAARGFYPCSPAATKTPSALLAASAFRPNDPLKRSEFARLMALLDQRRRAGSVTSAPGLPGGSLPDTGGPDEVITRIKACRVLVQFTGWAPAGPEPRYSDLAPGTADGAAAHALSAQHIDSQLWDGLEAMSPNGALIFGPDRPITRGQFAEMLVLAHTAIAPVWSDHPMDTQATIPVAPDAPQGSQ